MKEKILLIWKHLKQGTLKKMWKQTLWIYQYGRRYWKAMILYTLLGLVGTGVSLVSSLISRDLVDIVTGHQSGKLISTFLHKKDPQNKSDDFSGTLFCIISPTHKKVFLLRKIPEVCDVASSAYLPHSGKSRLGCEAGTVMKFVFIPFVYCWRAGS